MASALYLDRPFFGSRRMGSPDKTLKFYEGSFHDPLNDNDKGVVMQDTLGWINARIPATAGMAARVQGAPLRETLPE